MGLCQGWGGALLEEGKNLEGYFGGKTYLGPRILVALVRYNQNQGCGMGGEERNQGWGANRSRNPAVSGA